MLHAYLGRDAKLAHPRHIFFSFERRAISFRTFSSRRVSPMLILFLHSLLEDQGYFNENEMFQ